MNAAPTLEMLDPTTLIVDINVRKDAALTPEFIASIKEHGVIEPVIAHRNEDGTVHVRMGQRRTLGAIEASAATDPGDDHRIRRGRRADRLAGGGEHPPRRDDRGRRSRRLPPAVPDRRFSGSDREENRTAKRPPSKAL